MSRIAVLLWARSALLNNVAKQPWASVVAGAVDERIGSLSSCVPLTQTVISNAYATDAASKARKQGHRVPVILLKDVPRLGRRGTVKEANAGWMRHKLFPGGAALYATPENVDKYSLTGEEQEQAQSSEAEQRRQLIKIMRTLSAGKVDISRKSRWEEEKPDEMTGTVTAADICTAVGKQLGINLPVSLVMMDAPIDSYGSFKVPLNLRTTDDHQVEVTVHVHRVRKLRYGAASL